MAVTRESAEAAASMLAVAADLLGIYVIFFHIITRNYRRAAGAEREIRGAAAAPPIFIFEGPLGRAQGLCRRSVVEERVVVVLPPPSVNAEPPIQGSIDAAVELHRRYRQTATAA